MVSPGVTLITLAAGIINSYTSMFRKRLKVVIVVVRAWLRV
jgi:hypothetical protein